MPIDKILAESRFMVVSGEAKKEQSE